MGCEHGHGAAWRCETFSAAYVPARPALASQRRASRNARAAVRRPGALTASPVRAAVAARVQGTLKWAHVEIQGDKAMLLLNNVHKRDAEEQVRAPSFVQ